MKTIQGILASCLAAVPATGSLAQNSAKPLKNRPNVVFILADDLGYADVGCYGQKRIETPNIDQLAKEGVLFTQGYTGSPVSAPARCVLLTGKHTGHSYIRGNDEYSSRGDVWNYAKANLDPNLEGQAPLPTGTFTLGKLFQQAGYRTACIGKWGLGAPLTESTPNKMGFNFFYGYNCQRQAHNYYPGHLWKNDQKVWLDNEIVVPGTKLDKNADPLNPASYAKYTQKQYAPDLMLDETLHFFEEIKNQPFFLYFATTIPHVALQAPQRWVNYYVKKFGDEKPYLGESGYFPVRYPHASYAAMISYLDEQVGKMVAKLKELGIYDNTIIIFTSDNGPSWVGGADPTYFNSAAPFKGEETWGKGSLHEGGIREPLIISWKGVTRPGTKNNMICCFQDFLPTFAELLDIKAPSALDGISMVNAIKGKAQRQHPYLYFEFPEYGGQQAVRMGKWKAYHDNLQKENTPVQLFDLSVDLQEQHNIAALHPDIVKKMKDIMKKEHQDPADKKFNIKALQKE